MLDGKTVEDIAFGHEGLDGTQVTFLAYFDDGSEGIYIADIEFPVLDPADLNGSGEVNLDDFFLYGGELAQVVSMHSRRP